MRLCQRLFLLLSFCVPGVPLAAQIVQSPDSLADSTVVARPAVRAAVTKSDSLRHPSPGKKSPATAMICSAILPGAGQFYNESYWKVPIVLGFGVYFVSSWLDNNRRYEEYRDRYAASLRTDPAGDRRLLSVREFYREQRDSFTWYFLILYLINIADAYVDASLYDFNVGGDLTVRCLPPAYGIQVGVRFRF
ncbi:MAG: DUF5683 domain-containing protein [Bacteroidota bacterium]